MSHVTSPAHHRCRRRRLDSSLLVCMGVGVRCAWNLLHLPPSCPLPAAQLLTPFAPDFAHICPVNSSQMQANTICSHKTPTDRWSKWGGAAKALSSDGVFFFSWQKHAPRSGVELWPPPLYCVGPSFTARNSPDLSGQGLCYAPGGVETYLPPRFKLFHSFLHLSSLTISSNKPWIPITLSLV